MREVEEPQVVNGVAELPNRDLKVKSLIPNSAPQRVKVDPPALGPFVYDIDDKD